MLFRNIPSPRPFIHDTFPFKHPSSLTMKESIVSHVNNHAAYALEKKVNGVWVHVESFRTENQALYNVLYSQEAGSEYRCVNGVVRFEVKKAMPKI